MALAGVSRGHCNCRRLCRLDEVWSKKLNHHQPDTNKVSGFITIRWNYYFVNNRKNFETDNNSNANSHTKLNPTVWLERGNRYSGWRRKRQCSIFCLC